MDRSALVGRREANLALYSAFGASRTARECLAQHDGLETAPDPRIRSLPITVDALAGA